MAGGFEDDEEDSLVFPPEVTVPEVIPGVAAEAASVEVATVALVDTGTAPGEFC